MMRSTLVWACALGALTAGSAAAQETPTGGDVKATVTLGDTAAPPEWHLNIPVAVNLAPDAEVGRLSVRIVYPNNVLTYGKVRPTDTLKRAGFSVKAGKPETSGQTGSVTLDITPAPRTAKTLPSGTLVIVELQVDAKAPPTKSFPITAEDVQAWGPQPDSAQLKAAYSGPAKFLVTPPGLPIISCFFYMH